MHSLMHADSAPRSLKDMPGHILASTASYFCMCDLRSFECSSRDLVMRAQDDEAMWRAMRASVHENDRRQRVKRDERFMYGCPIHCMERNRAATLYRQSRALQRELVYYKLI